jgi:5'-nucleotidase
VLSGVNRGNNAAENVLYSGTIGGAMEAALQGLPAIALSQYYGPDNLDLETRSRPRPSMARRSSEALGTGRNGTATDYRVFYNVNFPPVPPPDVRGTRVTRRASAAARASVKPRDRAQRAAVSSGSPAGAQHVPTEPGSDAHANLDGYISVTPMRADLTAHDALDG